MSTNATLQIHNSDSLKGFSWPDYLALCIMLAFSLLIGIYFRIMGKNDTARQYLQGGRNMSLWPVAASLIVSCVSGLAFLGFPTEVYFNGSYVLIHGIPIVIAGVLTHYFYLPIYYDLQVISSYEYLELRFCKRTRTLASILFTISCIVYMPITVYIPGLALGQVSGINTYIITTVISTICIAYTVLGGIKAVLWTDFLQAVVMITAFLAIITLGIIRCGGFGNVWETNYSGGRIRHFEMNPSPFERTSFWTITIGVMVRFVGVTINQQSIQRYLSLGSLKRARISIYIFVIGLSLFLIPMSLFGLLLYAEYHDCDPVKSKKVSKPDQIPMYYIMDTISNIRGLPGLFMAGVLSAALSTLSSSLNSLSATVYEDFVSPLLKNRVSENSANKIMKTIVIIMGAVSISLVFIISSLGLLYQLTHTLAGLTAGTTLGLFSLGMFCPRANSKGAMSGTIASLLITGWLIIGNQKAIAEGKIKYTTLPTSAEGCGFNDTESGTLSSSEPKDDVFILYKLSFHYYCTVGVLLVFIVGIPVSFLTDPPELEKMNPILFTPLLRKYVMKKYGKRKDCNETETELLNVDS